ncbi:MAG TPA: ethanolamine ammonia-lyase subunit EutB, partial [bacterium]|nr:ethanolamine ammonia-lyase subunit EutB [bacterium]HOZ23005.1 ethanolamine ammonia-lyase subunit EutB [bacterium]
MKLSALLFGKTYQFKDIKDVLAKANELRSGDVLAGIAAETSQERVAAKYVLANLTLADLRNNPVIPYEEDAVTRVIQDAVNESVFAEIRNWTVGELREYVLCDRTTQEDIQRLRRGLTSEMVAACTKLMSNLDLIYGAKRIPVISKANTTVGLPGHFSARLQPNDPRDDLKSITAQIYEGLSYGVGDAVIGINPCIDSPENVKKLLICMQEIIDKWQIP